MPRKTEFTPIRKALNVGKINPDDLQNLREQLFFEIARCLEKTRDHCKALGLEPEEAGLSFVHPNESRGKHYASVSLRIG